MENQKLYIIGNGFDLHHKLETRYEHFCSYVKENESELHEFMEMYFYLTTDKDGLWSDFENDLGSFDHGQFYHHHDNSLPITSDKFKPSELYGVEDDLKQESEEIIEKLRGAFYNWLTQVEYSVGDIKLLPLDRESRFLSFNYTDTLNRLYDINKSSILHIHNAIESGKDNLIFGHGEKWEDEPLFDKNGESTRTLYSDAEGASKIILAFFYKDTQDIIRQNKKFFDSLWNIDEIIVLGHSINDIDLPYFEHINRIANKAKWTISYYTDSEPERMREALSSVGVKNNMSFKRMEDINH
jgi:hypothetical protein